MVFCSATHDASNPLLQYMNSFCRTFRQRQVHFKHLNDQRWEISLRNGWLSSKIAQTVQVSSVLKHLKQLFRQLPMLPSPSHPSLLPSRHVVLHALLDWPPCSNHHGATRRRRQPRLPKPTVSPLHHQQHWHRTAGKWPSWFLGQPQTSPGYKPRAPSASKRHRNQACMRLWQPPYASRAQGTKSKCRWCWTTNGRRQSGYC